LYFLFSWWGTTLDQGRGLGTSNDGPPTPVVFPFITLSQSPSTPPSFSSFASKVCACSWAEFCPLISHAVVHRPDFLFLPSSLSPPCRSLFSGCYHWRFSLAPVTSCRSFFFPPHCMFWPARRFGLPPSTLGGDNFAVLLRFALTFSGGSR